MEGISPDIILQNNWGQMKNSDELEKIVKEIIEKNPKAVTDFRLGKINILQFLVGQVMAKSRGTANPEKVRELLITLLK